MDGLLQNYTNYTSVSGYLSWEEPHHFPTNFCSVAVLLSLVSCFLLWFRSLLSWILFIWVFLLMLWYNCPKATCAPASCVKTHTRTWYTTRSSSHRACATVLVCNVTFNATFIHPVLTAVCVRLYVVDRNLIKKLCWWFLTSRLDCCLSEYRCVYCNTYSCCTSRLSAQLLPLRVPKNQHLCQESECVVRKCHQMTGKFFPADTWRIINPLTRKLWRTFRWLKGLWSLQRKNRWDFPEPPSSRVPSIREPFRAIMVV